MAGILICNLLPKQLAAIKFSHFYFYFYFFPHLLLSTRLQIV